MVYLGEAVSASYKNTSTKTPAANPIQASNQADGCCTALLLAAALLLSTQGGSCFLNLTPKHQTG
jgi:hypothetical protein